MRTKNEGQEKGEKSQTEDKDSNIGLQAILLYQPSVDRNSCSRNS